MRESSGGKDRGGERAEVTARGDSGGRRSRERGERQRKRDEIVIREVQRGDREGGGAAGPGEGEVQLTASFVGRRGRRETEVEGVKEREESSRVAGVGEMDVEVTQQDSRGRQRGEGGE